MLIEDLLNNKEARVAVDNREEAMVIGDIDVPVLSSASVASSLSNFQNSNPSPFVDCSLSSGLHNYGSSMANSSINRNISVQLELCRHQFLTTSRKTWESKTKAKGRATIMSMTQRTVRGYCCECEIQGYKQSKKMDVLNSGFVKGARLFIMG